MKINILVLLMACATALSALSADSIDIKVTGRIIVVPCVFNGGNSSMNVDLSSIQAMDMFTPESSPNPAFFSLLFTSCPPGTLSMTTRFSGTPDPEAGMNYYQNDDTATRMAITTSDATIGVLMGNGSSITQDTAADGTTKMPMKAIVTSVAGKSAPSSIRAIVVLTIQCN